MHIGVGWTTIQGPESGIPGAYQEMVDFQLQLNRKTSMFKPAGQIWRMQDSGRVAISLTLTPSTPTLTLTLN